MTTSNEWMQKAGELEAEVERLRGQLKDADERWGDEEKRALAAEAEVERLREKLDNVHRYPGRDEELERLREAARDADTLLTNYLAAAKFPKGSDCEEVRDALRAALEEKP